MSRTCVGGKEIKRGADGFKAFERLFRFGFCHVGHMFVDLSHLHRGDYGGGGKRTDARVG